MVRPRRKSSSTAWLSTRPEQHFALSDNGRRRTRRFAVTTANDPWGRVDADGTVYVRTADGERVIGSWAAGSPEEALVFFRRKYDSLETEVTLIEQRIATTEIAPAQAQATVQRLLHTLEEA